MDNSGITFVDLFVANETIHNSKTLSIGLLITENCLQETVTVQKKNTI